MALRFLTRVWGRANVRAMSRTPARGDTQRTPGQRLRDLRVRRGLTQMRLAVRAKVAIHTISFAEQDKRQPMPLTQERLARALRVNRWDIWPENDVEEAS